MAYLDANPPRIRQFRCPRRERPSGIIGVHTAESLPDETGPDTGAENVADFIRRRTNHGSYHLLADSDSIIQLVEFRCVAYHIGTHGLNEHTIGISAATQATKWNSLGAHYRDAMVRNMARCAAIAAHWLQDTYGITVPARRITLAQALRGERGFLAHGDADPDRRTDPGATFPWDDFLGYYADEMDGDTDMPLNTDDKNWLKYTLPDFIAAEVRTEVAKIADIRWGKILAERANDTLSTMSPRVASIQSAVNGEPVDVHALAAELAGLLLPEVREEVRAELADLDGVDEDAVADKVVSRVGLKLTAPDA